MQLGNVLYFLIWAGLFFVMMRFGCGSHIMGYGHHHGSGSPRDRHNDSWAASAQAVDPVCRMTVRTSAAKSAVYDGRPYYFCSQNCRDKFEAAPASYVKSATA